MPFRYLIAQLDGQDAAGLGGPAAPERPGGTEWTTYVAVDDADATAAAVERAGGQILLPPADAGEGGRSVLCADPEGLRFGLFQANRRLGAQVTNQPGAWNFSDLHTADPAGAPDFYTSVFGWEVTDLGFATMIRRPGYGDHLEATVDPGIRERQSGAMVPPGFADAIGWVAPLAADEEPHWHVTVHGRRPRRGRSRGRAPRRHRRPQLDLRLDPRGGRRRPARGTVHGQPVHPT